MDNAGKNERRRGAIGCKPPWTPQSVPPAQARQGGPSCLQRDGKVRLDRSPVPCEFYSQDMLSGVDLKALCERTRTANAQITMSFAQFEQLLVRVSKRIKGENRLRRVVEAVQVPGIQANMQKLTLSYCLDDCRLEDQPTRRVPASRWSEKSLPADYPRPSTLQDSVLTARSAGFSPIRVGRKPAFGVSTLDPARQSEGTPTSKLLEQVGGLVEGLRRKQETWHIGRQHCAKTQMRRLEDYVLRTRESHFPPAFVRRLVFAAWKKAVAS